jgi:phosphoglycerol transferase
MFARRDSLALAFLLLVVSIVWIDTYRRWTAPSWQVPVAYVGDAWFELTAIQGKAESGAAPFGRYTIPRLGTPEGADWSDYPLYDDVLNWSVAQGARVIGLFPAANLAVLLAHLLAAASCFLVCRHLGAARSWSAAVAGVYALSYYAFYRTLWHLSLLHYWHLPLAIAVVLRCLSTRRPALAGPALAGAAAIAFLTGLLEFYYSMMIGQFFALAAIFQAVRRGGARRVLVPIGLGGALVLAFLLTQFDTFSHHRENGPNPTAVVRGAGDVAVLALRPVQLVMPYQHAWAALQKWSRDTYWDTNPAGRSSERSTYLGVVGIAGLLAMTVSFVRRVHQRRRFSWYAPLAGWVMAWALPGGISAVLVLAGWNYIRANNRMSIFLLTFALLFLATALTAATRRWSALKCWVGAAALFALGAWDQARHPPAQPWPAIRRTVEADRTFARELEAAVGSRSDVFMLPALPFPEAGSNFARGFIDYEHLRLYLASKTLRLSYGAVRGRPQTDAAAALGQKPPAELTATIASGPWGAVVINRKGMPDDGAAILARLAQTGWTRRIESPLGDMVAVVRP